MLAITLLNTLASTGKEGNSVFSEGVSLEMTWHNYDC